MIGVDTSTCQEYYDSVVAFARENGRLEQFQKKLDHLRAVAVNTKGKLKLYKDAAPYSFEFSILKEGECVMNGGLIFHGAHDRGGDGGAPTFSVNLSPIDGWSIHT